MFLFYFKDGDDDDDDDLLLSHSETVALLEIWCSEEFQRRFDISENRKEVWEDVVKEMLKKGYNQCWIIYKDHLDRLMEEFYYICSEECTLP